MSHIGQMHEEKKHTARFNLFIIAADECLHAVRALAIPECYALTPPLFFLFNQPRSPTFPTLPVLE